MTEENTQLKSNNIPLITLGLIIVLILLVVGYFYFQKQNPEADTNNNPVAGDNTEIPEGFDVTGEGPVAKVGDTEISRTAYRQAVQQLVSNYAAQGITISDEETAIVKEQVITTLVNRELVLAAALQAGVMVDEAAVEAEYQNTATNLGGEEALQTTLSEAGITEEELRNDLREGLLINTYLDQRLSLGSLTVTDEEIENYYNTAVASASDTEVPPLTDVRQLIADQLRTEKQQQLVNEELERLRAEVEIEVLI